jgi:pyridoxamine 5'-phosphate oxidase-like protein
MTDERMLIELSPQESVQLLSSSSMGRVVFTARALPAIRPVNHLVDDDYVIIRTDTRASITSELRAGGETVVAYEADAIDQAQQLGWSVVVVGVAHRVIDPDEAAVYRRSLRSWAAGARDQVIAIHIDLITGFRLAPVPVDAAADICPAT